MSHIKQKHFYSHIIDVSSVTIELAEMELAPEERVHLISLAESNIHHAVLDTILSELPDEDKKEFLRHLRDDSHDKIWTLLEDKVDNIEDKIRKAAEDLKKELHRDIEEIKNKTISPS